jgi:protein-disulfide isomerase
MKRFVVSVSVLVAAGWVSAAQAQDTSKLAEYYKRKANVPPNVEVKVTGVGESKIKGAKSGTIEVGNQKVNFVMSEDGRYVVFGEMEDLTVDPFAAVMKKIDLKGQPFKGGKDAKVTIVEYSDFQCPFCTKGYNTIENQVLKEYGDKVKFYYKHLPLNFHPWAEPASIATECALQQKEAAYWKLYSYYFDNQKEITPQNLKEKTLEQLKGTGVDEAKFNDCFDNKKTLDRVKAQAAEAQSLGIQGTPGFIINGRALKGAYPFEQFKAIIDDELARAK